jgi:LacI family transcriptional regulator
MARWETIVRQIESEIRQGRHGRPAERFMTVRQLATRFDVSPVTAQKVVKALKEGGLLVSDSTNPAMIGPDAVTAAARPAGAAPGRLGMVTTRIASPFFSSLCRHVQHTAAARGLQVLVASSEYDFARERRAVESFLEIGVQGLLVVPGLDEACFDYYQELARRVPLVFISRRLEGVAADFVVADNFVAGAAVAGHFLSRGYTSLGYIGFGARLKRDVRLSGFRSALAEQDVPLEPERVVCDEGGTVQHGYRAMSRLMKLRPRPRAVFAFSDLLAIGALQYCQKHGIGVPEQVAIAGFDNLPQSQVTTPPLTSIAYPVEAMARLSVQCLVDRMAAGAQHAPSRILLEPHLVVRRSTDPQAPEPEPAGTGLESFEMI